MHPLEFVAKLVPPYLLILERNGENCTLISPRESIVLPTVKSKMLTSTVGYIRISQFAENTADDFETQFKELQSRRYEGIGV